MQTRFVVIPALPLQKEQLPRRIGVPVASAAGYDLYDTHCKMRLCLSYPTRAEADYQCMCRNSQEGAGGACVAAQG